MSVDEIQTRTLAEQPTAVRRATLTTSEMASWFGGAYGAVAQALGQHGAAPAGPPFARYRMLTGGRFEVEAGFPVRTAFTAENGVSCSTLPAGKVALVEYKGAYDGVDAAYSALGEWITDHGGIPSGDSWEVYIDSLDTDPADRRTKVFQPYD